MDKTKSFCISKHAVWDAYKRVKANRGSAGCDGQRMEDFEKDLKDNLFKIWNRMSSGSYMPPPVLRVEIPKGNGSVRLLGVPSVSDRIAQMVVKLYLEPELEKVFHPDSYGYRPHKSAVQAVGKARKMCWKYDWVVDLDIKGFFDNIDHDLMMRAVGKHTDLEWIRLYVKRWLKADVQLSDATIVKRDRGTPQGGVVSPLLANLFLHYAFDRWLGVNFPDNPFERYADDSVVHCRTEEEAVKLKDAIAAGMLECGLELHPEKTKIVYCRDGKRKENAETTQFDFLGFTFRARTSLGRGVLFSNFGPGISRKAAKAIRDKVRAWKVHRRSDLSIFEIAKNCNASFRGWINYYGKFHKSALYPTLKWFNTVLYRWGIRKYKRFGRSRKLFFRWLKRVAEKYPILFEHWKPKGVRTAIA